MKTALNKRVASPRRVGMTLVEMLIVSSMLALIMGAMAMVNRAGQDSFTATTLSSKMDSRTSDVSDRLLRELEGVSPTGVMVPLPGLGGTDTMLFQVPWGNLTQITYQMEAGEVDDGLDNDGDGMIDEGMVVLTRDVGGAGQISTVLCSGVAELLDGEVGNLVDDNGNDMDDESGFCLQTLGNLLIVRLTLLETDQDGKVLSRTVENSIRMRN